MAHVRVLQVAVSVSELGFEVFVANDAVGSGKAFDCASAGQRLVRPGRHRMSTETIVFGGLRDTIPPRSGTVSSGLRQAEATEIV